MERIKAQCEVEMWEEEYVPVLKEVLEQKITGIDGLYCFLTDVIDETLLQRAERLKVVSNMAVGYNNIDVNCATSRGVYVN